ncbi:hypothetical protein C8R48DRAFT_673999 [Suillus tomentosus]|nr:hypothetical protein C8R48DRAFT_673999 [Suillus tomentosus]
MDNSVIWLQSGQALFHPVWLQKYLSGLQMLESIVPVWLLFKEMQHALVKFNNGFSSVKAAIATVTFYCQIKVIEAIVHINLLEGWGVEDFLAPGNGKWEWVFLHQDVEPETFATTALNQLIGVEKKLLDAPSSLRLMVQLDVGVMHSPDGLLGYFITEVKYSMGIGLFSTENSRWMNKTCLAMKHQAKLQATPAAKALAWAKTQLLVPIDQETPHPVPVSSNHPAVGFLSRSPSCKLT